MRKPILLSLAVVVCAVAAHSQKPSDDKVMPLAKLEAPVSVTFKSEDLEWLRYGGTITATVLVDKKGKITVADLMGPMAPCSDLGNQRLATLRTAVMEAVKKAKIDPATDADGKPVDSGVLIKITVPQHEVPPNALAGGQLPAHKVVVGGVINGKALSLAKPEYPPDARANRAAGQVKVQVLIDEDGKVVYAGAIEGNAYLRFSAADAACHSRFSPTTLAGHPVKVSGIITYHFIP